jgi:superfamily II helicase
LIFSPSGEIGKHTALKMLRHITACGFESRLGYFRGNNMRRLKFDSNKHRCRQCRKKRKFTMTGTKAWKFDDKKLICCFCAAKESGTLDQLKSDLGNMRKLNKNIRKVKV